jgi:hypothetical protein
MAAVCTTYPEEVDVGALIDQADLYATQGMISQTRYMAGDRVFIIHGALDTACHPGESKMGKTKKLKAQDFYLFIKLPKAQRLI